MNILINGAEYKMATTLRVAYKIQSSQGHKPYMEIFKNMATLSLENQIKILYASYSTGNQVVMTEKDFIDYVLDNFNLDKILEMLGGLVDGIMYNGYSEDEISDKKKIAEEQRAQTQ